MLAQADEEGGIGIRDPRYGLDTAKNRMVITLVTKDRQSWMRWIERKMRRLGEQWGLGSEGMRK